MRLEYRNDGPSHIAVAHSEPPDRARQKILYDDDINCSDGKQMPPELFREYGWDCDTDWFEDG
jgi:hypothetical protein